MNTHIVARCFADTNIHHRPAPPQEWWEACAVKAAWGANHFPNRPDAAGNRRCSCKLHGFLKIDLSFFPNIKVINACSSPNTGMHMKIINTALWSLPPRTPTVSWSSSVFLAARPGCMFPTGLVLRRWFAARLAVHASCVDHSLSSQTRDVMKASCFFSLQRPLWVPPSPKVLPRAFLIFPI